MACEARNRLKSGYWSGLKQNRETDILKAESEGKDPEKIKEYYRSKFDADFRRDDEAFYQKVVEILTSRELVTNPIARLMDESVFAQLNNGERQRYVLEIADKFRKMSERFEREQTLKSYLVH